MEDGTFQTRHDAQLVQANAASMFAGSLGAPSVNEPEMERPVRPALFRVGIPLRARPRFATSPVRISRSP